MNTEIIDKYELVVGLEVHVQLATKSKMFASDVNNYGDAPNTNISVITLAHPGTLPKVNETAFEFAIKMGLACDCEISKYNVFDRKNYFYPDLPKGYQLTQDKTPICIGGKVSLRTGGKDTFVQLNRIHLEEDAGKSIHSDTENYSFIDLNRAGTPLIEIVTEPTIHRSEDAFIYLNQVQRLVRYLEISDGNMEEGSLRCDANISIRKKGSTILGDRAEVKNMNSPKNVQKAIEYEFLRQIALLEKGEKIVCETRTYDANKNTTASMRLKESLNDYRYFPDPDLPPVLISAEMIAEIQSQMPPLPEMLFDKFVQEYQLSDYDAKIIIDTKESALYFEEICRHTKNYKSAANWMLGNIKSYLNEHSLKMAGFPLSASQIASIILLVDEKKISFSSASQTLFGAFVKSPKSEAEQLAKKLDIIQESDGNVLEGIIKTVLERNPKKVKEYQENGKKNLIGMFMGQVMQLSKGKINPQKANQALRKALEK